LRLKAELEIDSMKLARSAGQLQRNEGFPDIALSYEYARAVVADKPSALVGASNYIADLQQPPVEL
jgi:hypothetical protein